MSAPSFTRFEELLLTRHDAPGVSVLLVLAWLAASDGPIDAAETGHLKQAAAASGHEDVVEPILALVADLDADTLQLACEFVGRHFRQEKAPGLVKAAIGMALADGRLRPAENHVLRWLADLVGLTRATLAEAFLDATGQSLPNLPDPSRSSYWASRESDARRRAPAGAQKHTRAYATLGLPSGATKDEIRSAYRRLARVHHPDRFCQMGPEAVATATLTFQRIKAAYEHLVSHA